MDSKAKVDAAKASLDENRAKRSQLLTETSAVETDLATARDGLQRLQSSGRAADPRELGAAMLLVQGLEVQLEGATADHQVTIQTLDSEAAQLQEKFSAAVKLHERKVYFDLVIEYETLIRPAWALAEKIRAQASRCNIPLEAHTPLVDRDHRTIGGYEVRERADRESILSSFSLPKIAA